MAVEGLGGGGLGWGTGYIAAFAMRRVNEPGLRLLISLGWLLAPIVWQM